jgi:hypothetical protein
LHAVSTLIRFIAPVLITSVSPAFAWVYPEHRELALQAVQGLDADRKAVFEQLWLAARTGDEQQLCVLGADTGQGVAPACIDWAAMTAIAGDHSCSSREMFETARASKWILSVADVAAQLKVDLARIPVTAAPEASGPIEDVLLGCTPPPREPGHAGRAHQCAAHCRQPPAARGPRIRDRAPDRTTRTS